MIRSAAAALLLVVPSALGTVVSAQRPSDIVKWSAKPAQVEVKAGSVVPLEITADVQRGWYLYGLAQPKGGPIPLNFAGARGKLFQVQPRGIKGPEPIAKDDPIFDLETTMHGGKTTFTVPILVARGVAAGRQTIPIEVTFQACGDGICLRPYTHTITVDVTVK
jgi:hypothetical protein